MVRFRYLFTIALVALLGWGSTILVIRKMSPFFSGYLPLILFYLSLWIALAASLSLLFYCLRRFFGSSEMAPEPFNTALREGFLLSILVCVGLIFQRLRVLTWWDALLLLFIGLLIEVYFLSRE